MNQQHLDYKSPGFTQFLENIESQSVSLHHHHSYIILPEKTKWFLLENEIMSNCGRIHFNKDDILGCILHHVQSTQIIELHFRDTSSVRLELPSVLNQIVDQILQSIEIDLEDQEMEKCCQQSLCESCKKYEKEIIQHPQSHPISTILEDCYSNQIPLKIEFGFDSSSYSYEGELEELSYLAGSIQFKNAALNSLYLARVHSITLYQEPLDGAHYTTLSAFDSFGEKIYTLSVKVSSVFEKWKYTLSQMCSNQ